MIDSRWVSGEKLSVPVCDMCEDELEAEYDFEDAVEVKKAAGWRSVKLNGEWTDLCPECYTKYCRQPTAADDFKGVL